MNIFQSYKTLKKYRQNPLKFIEEIYSVHGHRAHLKIFGKNLFIISHPDDVSYVLKMNSKSYTKGRTTKALRKFLGSGLVTNEGESWRKQHRLIRPLMNLKNVYQMAPRILETTTNYVNSLDVSKDINSFEMMNRLTWRIILKTLFSQEPTPEMDEWLKDILKLMHIITGKTRSSLPMPFWIPTSDNLKLKKIIKKFDQHVYGLIRNRRVSDKKDDLLQLLIDAQEEGTVQMTDREIRDEIMTFMMAGHETITNSMTWTLIELAKNPDYKEKLLQEISSFFSDLNYEQLNTLPLLNSVIDESMRLHPAIWVFMRQAEVPDQIGDMKIPPKSNVVLAPYNTHRAHDLWEEPLRFYPERFLGDEKKKLSPGAFYPFGLGPRACIGASFAGIEAKIILASILNKYDFKIDRIEDQKYDAGISLRPLNNILMTFRKRV